MGKFKKFISTVLSVMMMTSLIFGTAWGATPWNAQIRPGVVVGTGSQPTDFNVDFLLPLAGDKKYIFFFNPNGRFDDNSGNEQNLGLGYRRMLSGDKAIVGLNAYYDTMKSNYGNRYDQFGVGAEVLSEWVDFRANYYNPLGNSKNRIHKLDKYEFAKHSLIFSKGMEEALRGFDAEVGVLIPGISNIMETRAFLGGFWYDADIIDNLNGWKGRLEIRPSKLININAEVRHDSFRGTESFIGAYLDIPFSLEELAKGGNPFKGFKEATAFGKGSRTIPERMVQKVVRDPYITAIATASRDSKDTETIVLDMIYVNKDNADDTKRDGSLKHPWKSLEEAEAEDPRWCDQGETCRGGAWVYVFSYDKNADTFEDNHTQLGDNMVLWGQGYYHPVFKLGGYKGKNSDQLMPILDGAIGATGSSGSTVGVTGASGATEPLKRECGNGSVVCLGDNNEIMGLTIQNGTHGIYGYSHQQHDNPADYYIKSTYIHDNLIQNNTGITNSGIHIENYFDSADMSNQNLSYRFVNNRIYNNAGSGIFLRNSVSGSTSLDNFHILTEFTKNEITGTSSGYITSNGSEDGYSSGNAIVVDNNVCLDSMSYCDSDRITSLQTAQSDNSLSISNSSITNTFTDNRIDNNDGSGILLNNRFSTSVHASDSVEESESVSSTISNTQIKNSFENNTITDRPLLLEESVRPAGDGGYRNGIEVTNTIDAGISVDYDVSDSAAVTASVTGSTIENKLANNTITFNQDNGTGILLGNSITAYNYVYDIYGKYYDMVSMEINGSEPSEPAGPSVTALVDDSHIMNELSSNSVAFKSEGLSGTGVFINNQIGAMTDIGDDIDYWGGTDTVVNVTSSVKDSDISNKLTGTGNPGTPEVSFADSANESTGIFLQNAIFAGILIDEDTRDIYDNASVNVSAYVESGQINNELTNNTITFGSNAYAMGMGIYNGLGAVIIAANDGDDYGIEDLYDSAAVNVSAYVQNGSKISNTLTDNTVTFGSSADAAGMEIGSIMFALHGGIPEELMEFTGDFSGAEILYTPNFYIDPLYDSSEVHISSVISDSSIENELTGNRITFDSSTYSRTGINIMNGLVAGFGSDGDIEDLNDQSKVFITAEVTDSSINNTLELNEVKNPNGLATGIDIYNALGAYVGVDDIGHAYCDYYEYDCYVDDGLWDQSYVSLTSKVSGSLSGINNTLKDNTVSFDDYVSGENYANGTGILIYNYLGAAVHIDEISTLGAVYTDYYDNYNYDYDDDHYFWDTTARVVANSEVSGAGIMNELTGNRITYGIGGWGTGIEIHNAIAADTEVADDDIYDLNDDARVELMASVRDSSISNTVDNNCVAFGTDCAVEPPGLGFFVTEGPIGGGTGIDIENEIFAGIYVDEIYDIFNNYSPESISGSLISGSSDEFSPVVILDATVSNSTIENKLANNRVEFTGGAAGSGIELNNSIGAEANVDWIDYVEEGAGINQKANIATSGITNELSNNVLYGNGGDGPDGISIENWIWTYFDDTDYDGYIVDLIDHATIRNDLTGNRVYDFGDDGVDIWNSVEGGWVEDSIIEDYFTGNTITGNNDTGIHLSYYTFAFIGNDNLINVFMEGNTVTDSINGSGVYLDYGGSGGDAGCDGDCFDSNIDLGGGALGSQGKNNLSGNDNWQFDTSDFDNIKAEYNYWGTWGEDGPVWDPDEVDWSPYYTDNSFTTLAN